jgi:hypothetical protein
MSAATPISRVPERVLARAGAGAAERGRVRASACARVEAESYRTGVSGLRIQCASDGLQLFSASNPSAGDSAKCVPSAVHFDSSRTCGRAV